MDKSEKGLDVLFLGDSAIESLRGTYLGSSWTAFATVARSFKELLPGYSTRALGIAGFTSLIAVSSLSAVSQWLDMSPSSGWDQFFWQSEARTSFMYYSYHIAFE